MNTDDAYIFQIEIAFCVIILCMQLPINNNCNHSMAWSTHTKSETYFEAHHFYFGCICYNRFCINL